MAKIGAHKSEAFNLLKLNYNINDDIVWFLGFRSDQFIHDFVGGKATMNQYRINGKFHHNA